MRQSGSRSFAGIDWGAAIGGILPSIRRSARERRVCASKSTTDHRPRANRERSRVVPCRADITDAAFGLHLQNQHKSRSTGKIFVWWEWELIHRRDAESAP